MYNFIQDTFLALYPPLIGFEAIYQKTHTKNLKGKKW